METPALPDTPETLAVLEEALTWIGVGETETIMVDLDGKPLLTVTLVRVRGDRVGVRLWSIPAWRQG